MIEYLANKTTAQTKEEWGEITSGLIEQVFQYPKHKRAYCDLVNLANQGSFFADEENKSDKLIVQEFNNNKNSFIYHFNLGIAFNIIFKSRKDNENIEVKIRGLTQDGEIEINHREIIKKTYFKKESGKTTCLKNILYNNNEVVYPAKVLKKPDFESPIEKIKQIYRFFE